MNLNKDHIDAVQKLDGANIRRLCEIRDVAVQFRRFDVVGALDHHVELIRQSARIQQRRSSLAERVRRGEIADFVAAFECGMISAALRTMQEKLSDSATALITLFHWSGEWIQA